MYDPNHFKHLFTLGRCFYKAYKDNYPFRTVELEGIAKYLSCKT
ncbi:IS91 family transposase, partial [Aliivibrio sifiae]